MDEEYGKPKDASVPQGKEISDNFSDAEKVSAAREKLKAENDAYEAEKLRAEQLRAEQQVGGRSAAGSESLTPEDAMKKKAEEEAREIVDAFH